MTRGIKNNLPDRWCRQCGNQMFGRRQFDFCCSKCALTWENTKKPQAKFKSLNCLCCGGPLISKHQKKFCSKSCAGKINSRGVDRYLKKRGAPKKIVKCLKCSQDTYNEKYCSNACKSDGQRKYATPEEAYKARLAIHNEHWHRYMAQKKNQTPRDVDVKKLQEIYLNCPSGHEVDHIIPISKGGLHHPDNLQYLTVSENRRKSNKILQKVAREVGIEPTQ